MFSVLLVLLYFAAIVELSQKTEVNAVNQGNDLFSSWQPASAQYSGGLGEGMFMIDANGDGMPDIVFEYQNSNPKYQIAMVRYNQSPKTIILRRRGMKIGGEMVKLSHTHTVGDIISMGRKIFGQDFVRIRDFETLAGISDTSFIKNNGKIALMTKEEELKFFASHYEPKKQDSSNDSVFDLPFALSLCNYYDNSHQCFSIGQMIDLNGNGLMDVVYYFEDVWSGSDKSFYATYLVDPDTQRYKQVFCKAGGNCQCPDVFDCI